MVTYKEQFDKLTRAYINGEVDPWDCKACFVGNLLNNNSRWGNEFRDALCGSRDGIGHVSKNSSYIEVLEVLRLENNNYYTPEEIANLEATFLFTINNNSGDLGFVEWWHHAYKINEDALFIAFEKTLEYLKEIHISKGEIIEDNIPSFKKRELALNDSKV